jgi:hypothetical protein
MAGLLDEAQTCVSGMENRSVPLAEAAEYASTR